MLNNAISTNLNGLSTVIAAQLANSIIDGIYAVLLTIATEQTGITVDKEVTDNIKKEKKKKLDKSTAKALKMLEQENQPAPKKSTKASKSRGKYNRRRVNQLSKTGKVLKTFDSIADAARAIGVSANSICGCCRGSQCTTGGGIGKTGKYRFAYAD